VSHSGIKISIFVMACVLAGCQTSEIKINSEPAGATVEVLNPSNQGYLVVGKTPYTVEGESSFKLFRTSNILSVRISKPGFVIEHLFIDKSNNPKVIVNTQLKSLDSWQVGPKEKEKDVLSEHASTVAAGIQNINAYIQARQFEKALSGVRELLATNPASYFLYDMKGSIHLLRGEKAEALSSFQKSLAIFPNNPATAKAVKDLGSR
jgi:tetratricopeptide (TPR) repeat protein